MAQRARFIAVALVFLGCPRAPSSERAYGFLHLETTGITSSIVASPGATPVNIHLSGDSDREAFESFLALGPEVLLPNANGEDLIVVGVLEREVLHTPSVPGLPQSEPYQEFRLSRWYLRAPFLRREVAVVDTQMPRREETSTLKREDFTRPIAGDLSRFVHAR